MTGLSHLTNGIRRSIWFFSSPETDWDREPFFYSHDDRPLTERGRKCVHEISGNLIALKLSRLIASKRSDSAVLAESLRRSTKSTPNIEYDQNWSSNSYGSWEGLSHSAAMAQNPEAYAKWKNESWLTVPPGGESKKDASARIISSLEKILTETEIGSIGIVADAFPIQVCLCHALGIDLKMHEKFLIEQSSISTLESSKDGFRLVNLNFKLFGRDRTNPIGRDAGYLSHTE